MNQATRDIATLLHITIDEAVLVQNRIDEECLLDWSECTQGQFRRAAREAWTLVQHQTHCDFCLARGIKTVAVLKADPDQKVCQGCHDDPRIETEAMRTTMGLNATDPMGLDATSPMGLH